MRLRLFPSMVVLLVLVAGLLFWLWSSDAVLIRKCGSAGGKWDAEARSCMLQVTPGQAVPVSPPE